jgi:hypothetical protein
VYILVNLLTAKTQIMRKLRLLTLSSLAVLFIASSCTKEGPEGPAGATGAQGPAGSAGAPGTPGAGVTTYSAWFTPGSAAWSSNATAIAPYGAAYIYDKAATVVTQGILDNGIILSFAKGLPIEVGATVVPTTYVSQLPFTETTYLDVYDFAASLGKITYIYKAGSAPWLPAALATITLRYVVIPGTILTGRSAEPTYGGFTKEELGKMSYEQVAAEFELPADGSNIK